VIKASGPRPLNFDRGAVADGGRAFKLLLPLPTRHAKHAWRNLSNQEVGERVETARVSSAGKQRYCRHLNYITYLTFQNRVLPSVLGTTVR
jgi:hypothetical protein